MFVYSICLTDIKTLTKIKQYYNHCFSNDEYRFTNLQEHLNDY